MEHFENADYYRELLGYWKNQDTLITRRATVFVTGNAIMFFAFRANLKWQLFLAVFVFAVLFNLAWFLLGRRTSSTYDKMYAEIARLEGIQQDASGALRVAPQDPERAVYWNVIRRSGCHVSATKVLCLYVPLLFVSAWIVFYAISLVWGIQ
ncbi:MAG: hypothetical protein GF330_04960 [Candidatus Eisenbacteria bacterium]|nr:hypothetical protein [Candidatus Eisenbacteria bacterium]